MINWTYHALMGNDAHPAAVAFARGLLTAVIAGAVSFFGVWQTTDELKVLVTSGVVPFLTVFAARVLGEGYIDVRKHNGPSGS